MTRSVLLAALASAGGLAVLGTSCGAEYTGAHDFVRTATVALDRETTFIVDAPVDLVVEGHPRSSDLVYTLKATATASTASAAQALAEAVVLETVAVEPRGIRLVMKGMEPKNGLVRGVLRVQLPDDMDLFLVGRGASVNVDAMEGDMEVAALGHARVDGAVGNVKLGSQSGNALLSASPLPGSIIEVLAVRGDVQLSLPAVVSAQIQATPGGGGQVVIRHPGLPAGLGGTAAYAVVVGGGLSLISLVTQAGNIVIQ